LQIKRLGIVIFSFLLVILIANTHASSAFVEKQNQSNKTNQVYIQGCDKRSCFSSCQTIILKGDTVTWTNLDSITHMVVSGSGQNGPDGWFSSSFILPHGIFSHKFERTGTFVYYDLLHPYTEGVVIVGSAIDSPFVHLAQSFFSNWCSR
jgi:plastocyanin